MPLEVREIGIRMRVGDEDDAVGGQAASGGSDEPAALSPLQRAALIDECVDAVLAALRRREER